MADDDKKKSVGEIINYKGADPAPSPLVRRFGDKDPGFKPDLDSLAQKRAKAEAAKAKYMQDNGVDEDGNPVKPTPSPSPEETPMERRARSLNR